MVRALRRQRPLSPNRRGPPHARHLSAMSKEDGGLSDAVRGRQVGSCEDWPVGGPVPQTQPSAARAHPDLDRPVSA